MIICNHGINNYFEKKNKIDKNETFEKMQNETKEFIKEITKKIITSSIKDWRKNKEKKGIDTSHFILEIIAPHERLISAIIQSCQTSLGNFWEKLIKEIASSQQLDYELIRNND